ncbi:MAG: hypothetical protein P8X69_11450 [Maritimibacter sp.]
MSTWTRGLCRKQHQFETASRSRRSKKKTPDAVNTINVHFRPQVDFVLPETRLFHFEAPFAADLAEAYGMEVSEIDKINAAPKKLDSVLSADVEDWIRHYYAEDFSRFGYET